MTGQNVIEEVRRVGGVLWLESGKVKYRLPPERMDLLEKLRAHREEIVIALSGSPIPRLPFELERLVSAANHHALPNGTAKLSSGIVPDLNQFVTSWAVSHLLGAQNAEAQLWQAWTGGVAA